MKGSLIGYSLLMLFEAVNALYPVNINQVKNYDASEHKFQRRMDKQDIKPFNVTIDCSGSHCKKASETLDRLTNTLSSFIQIRNQINVRANFASFCKEYDDCDKNNKSKIGFGIPSEFSAIENKEGFETLYPLALYKQLADPSRLEYISFLEDDDITLYFNDDIRYWFEGDGNIEANQPKFLLVAANGLIRGLGLRSSIAISEQLGSIISPGYDVIFADNSDDIKRVYFNRHIFDSLLVTTSDGKSFNDLLDPYFSFKLGNTTVPYEDLDIYFKNTTLVEASKKIEKLATTPDSLAIKLPSGKSLVLETSVQPYDRYRSLYCISESKYLHTKEALLTSKVYYGEEPLTQGKVEDWPTYPYGPLLIETLEYIGYTLKDSYKNSVASSSSNKGDDKENSKSGNNSSNVKVNFGLLTALVSLYLLS